MLVSVNDVKKYLQYEGDGNDGVIEDLIERVEAAFKEFLGGTTFDAGDNYNTETDYADGDRTDTIIVSKLPIRAVTSIHLDTDRVYGSDTAVDADDIIDYEYGAGVIRLESLTTPRGRASVKVVYTAGWKTTDAPADFKQIIINEAVALLLEGVGAVNVVEEGDVVYRPAKLRQEANRLKEKYKIYGHIN